MRLTGSRVYSRPPPVPKMPPGLEELMDGLTKDVLKNNPPEVYEFCAEHMRKLLEIRDGPTTKKTLSLDQKISRAQEKVRKRSEERWRKFNNDFQFRDSNLGTEYQNPDKQNAVISDLNMTHSYSKPDITQDSKTEISCDTNNTDLIHCKVNAEQILVTAVECENVQPIDVKAVESENDAPKNDNQTAVKDDDIVEDNFNNQLNPENENTNIGQLPDDDRDQLNSSPKEMKTTEKNQSGEESVKHFKEDSEPFSNPIVAVSVNDVKDETTTEMDGQDKVRETEDSSVAIAHDTDTAIEDKSDDIQTCNTIKLPNSENNNSHSETEMISNFKKNNESMSAVEAMENDNENTKTSILDLSNKDNTKDDCENEKEHSISDDKGQNNDVTEDVLSEPDTKIIISDVDFTNETKESTTDLEKVMNEAIENIKRKDSCADDSTQGNIVCYDESDVSEGANLVKEHVHENDANILTEREDSDHSKKIENHDNNFKSEDHSAADIQSLRFKRSLDVINTEQLNVDQDDLETTSKTFNDSSSTLADDIVDRGDMNKTSKIDNSNAMDLETAAVTIQKVFRTFLFKSRASTFEESVNEENNLSDDDDKQEDVFVPTNNINKERRTLGISRMDTVLQTVNEEKSLSLSTDDSSLSSAATIIQAHVRGFLLRNKLHSVKSASRSSLGKSNGPSSTSLDGDVEQNKSKTVLNIHIVPEGSNYLSRDESMITSMDLSLDGSPPSSVNLHPLGYNKSERKQLKREDAVQSISPPSNNSGKLSEDVDSIKELPIIEQDSNVNQEHITTDLSMLKDDSQQESELPSLETTPSISLNVETVVENHKTSNTEILSSPEPHTDTSDKTKRSLTKQSSDEMDVITPFKENSSLEDMKLLHSGEFHDSALPTKISRSDTPVVSGE